MDHGKWKVVSDSVPATLNLLYCWEQACLGNYILEADMWKERVYGCQAPVHILAAREEQAAR